MGFITPIAHIIRVDITDDTSFTIGANNTKSAYTEYIASTYLDTSFLVFNMDYGAATQDSLIDIAIGTAGSERIIFSNLCKSSSASNQYNHEPFAVPFSIPKGTRLAIRGQSNNTSADFTSNADIQLFAGRDIGAFQVCDTYGANEADSGGTSVDPGGSSWTWGNYSQLVASTTRNHKGIILGFGSLKNTARVEGAWNIQIAVGAAGSEQVILRVNATCGHSAGGIKPQFTNLYAKHIPISVRLSARAQSSITDSTDRLIDVIAYCFA